MSQQAPPQYSPDGRFWWNGQAWVPVSPVAAVARTGHGARNVAIGCGALIGLLVLLGTIGSIANSGRATPTPPARATTAATGAAPASNALASAAPARDGSCAPQPCANDNYGWIVNVSNVRYGASSGNPYDNPEAGNVFVAMDLTFTNKTSNPQSASLFYFKLLDGNGVSHNTSSMIGCGYWSSVDIAPGGSYGPKCTAFQATAGKPAGLVLVWNPSGFGGTYKIKLT
jgi:hypothetical protein